MQILKPSWFNVASALQDEARQHREPVILTIRVLVTAGDAEIYTFPKVVGLKPARYTREWIDKVLDSLTEGSY